MSKLEKAGKPISQLCPVNTEGSEDTLSVQNNEECAADKDINITEKLNSGHLL